MGLPEINITFATKGQTAIQRSARGIVACILKDNTEDGAAETVYTSLADVDFEHWSQRNYEYLKLILAGGPSKVLVLRIKDDAADYTAALKTLKSRTWNYLTIPSLTTEQTARWSHGSNRPATATTRRIRRCWPTQRRIMRVLST